MPSNNIYYCSCVACKTTIATRALQNHYQSKSCLTGGKHPKKSDFCKFCHKDLTSLPSRKRSSHVRWCRENPNFARLVQDSVRRLTSPKARELAIEKIKQHHKNGTYAFQPAKSLATKKLNNTLRHSPDAIENIRKAALASRHVRVCSKSHTFIDKQGRSFTFDSSWEDALATRLDELDVIWDRPGPIEWVDYSGRTRHYFPDFYLPDFDLYLDPKNAWVEQKSQEKLQIVSKLISLVILRSLQECKSYVPAGPDSNRHNTD